MLSNAPRPTSSSLGPVLLCLVCLVAGALVSVNARAASVVDLKGPQITAAVSGKYITDGHHWGHHYLPDGRVLLQDGAHERVGRWSVDHARLCLVDPRISATDPVCYAVQQRAGQLQYVDDTKQMVYQGSAHGRADARAFSNANKR